MDNTHSSLINQLRLGILAKLKKDCQFIYSDQLLNYQYSENIITS